jgi:hypothetical protein
VTRTVRNTGYGVRGTGTQPSRGGPQRRSYSYCMSRASLSRLRSVDETFSAPPRASHGPALPSRSRSHSLAPPTSVILYEGPAPSPRIHLRVFRTLRPNSLRSHGILMSTILWTGSVFFPRLRRTRPTHIDRERPASGRRCVLRVRGESDHLGINRPAWGRVVLRSGVPSPQDRQQRADVATGPKRPTLN